MKTLLIRDLSIDEMQQVSGSNLVYAGIVGGAAGAVGVWIGKQIVDWFDSPPGPSGPGISKAIIGDLKPYVDIDEMCKPLPGDEVDYGG